MVYSLSHIASILATTYEGADISISQLLLDSRKVYSAPASLFFALRGPRRDGHQFLAELYRKGVRAFVVSETPDIRHFPGAGFLQVENVLWALQQLAAFHRRRFDIPVIGITGSNGKTIVKEWLYQLLHEDFDIVRSPKSYNSQVGVPLSVWHLEQHHNLAIFEAGISQPGEMKNLEPLIRPLIGVLTNIGEAHNEGFAGQTQKLAEKLQLFRHCQVLIGREADLKEHEDLLASLDSKPVVITWGSASGNFLSIKETVKSDDGTDITVCTGAIETKLFIPFTDEASIENAITCYLVLLQLGIKPAIITNRLRNLQPVNMRLELKKGINHCVIINDSYSADINSLEIALDFLVQQKGYARKTVILSDLLQTATGDKQLYSYIIDTLKKHRVDRLIGIGERITETLRHLHDQVENLAIELHSSTADYLQQFRSLHFREEIVLVKGARVFGFEQIVQALEQKAHQTVLEINLNAIVHNVKVYQRQLQPETKIMAMVKAFAYGSGGAEIAGILQYHKVDYLGVAYADEGVELRKAGISLPIMVMNPEERAFESIVEYNLEPDLYSFELLHAFETFLRNEGLQTYPVHIEVETGLNRLGFEVENIHALAQHLQKTNLIKVQSIFSHLSASEDQSEDVFTRHQFDVFQDAADRIREKIDYDFLRHISNSAGIFRLPYLQLDMVRLGIGMYGVDSSSSHQELLQPVATLKTTIAQVKQVKAGESVGYNRKGRFERDAVIATVRIGYADGYARKFGNGAGKMLVHGIMAPVVGSVCMDMTMLDVTAIPGVAREDEVIVFGENLPIQNLAQWAGTIPYEIMTSISQRVKRIYFEE